MIESIYALYPEVVLTRGDDAFDAEGNPVLYDKEAVIAHAALNDYKNKRASEYPSFADQFDIIFHSGLEAWKAQIQAVKDKYPKGA